MKEAKARALTKKERETQARAWDQARESARQTLGPIGDREAGLLAIVYAVDFSDTERGTREAFFFRSAQTALGPLSSLVEWFERQKGESDRITSLSTLWDKGDPGQDFANRSPELLQNMEDLGVEFALTFVIYRYQGGDVEGADKRAAEVSAQLGDVARSLGAAGPARAPGRADRRVLESDLTLPLVAAAQALELEAATMSAGGLPSRGLKL